MGNVTIANYTANCRTFHKNKAYGVNNLKLVQDANGMATGYLGDDVVAFANGDDRNLPMNFYPNLERYRITEVVGGELQDFGSELVTNGTFDTDTTGWASINTGTITWNNGEADVAANGHVFGGASQSRTVTSGESYLISVKVSSVSGTGTIGMSGGLLDSGLDIATTGYHTKVVTAASSGTNNFYIIGNNDATFTATIDNISFKQLTTKTERKEYRALEHDAKVEGSELCLDAGFDNASNWDNVTAFDVIDSKIKSTGLSGPIYQITDNIENGKSYEYSLDVEAYSSSAVYLKIGGNLIQITGVGTITGVVTSTVSTDGIGFVTGGAGGAGFIADNLSVKELTEENNLYINGVLDTTTPVLPDPSTVFTQKDVALIGYGDTITRRYKPFEVSTEWKTAAQHLADYNAWLLINEDVLLDEFGTPLEDENGVYLYS